MKKYLLALAVVILAIQAHAVEFALSKARDITLPALQYREATLRSILDDIQKKSVEADPEKLGVNFVVKLDDTTLDKKLTMTLNSATIERSLNVLAATVSLYIQYDPGAIVIQKSERITTEQ